MELLEDRLEKRIHISLYAILFLTLLLGLSVLLEDYHKKREVQLKSIDNSEITLTKRSL